MSKNFPKNTYFQNHCNFLLAQKRNYLVDIRTDAVVAFLRCELKWPNTCRSELLFHSKIPRTVAKQIQSPAVILSMDWIEWKVRTGFVSLKLIIGSFRPRWNSLNFRVKFSSMVAPLLRIGLWLGTFETPSWWLRYRIQMFMIQDSSVYIVLTETFNQYPP